MKRLKSYEIRKMWLDFFRSKGHEIIPSASLVPVNDPTLLWINAGVAPLKKYFDGREIPNNRRMANAQKSIRTNDIENVGRTARHHTFFEMLGNFSIGDYFRKEALEWGFELLTSPQWFGFELEKLYFTVHPSDQESKQIWHRLGVPWDHLIELEGNFWEIGEGPCGPDTEIFYDRGEKYDPQGLGKRLLTEEIENDRYIEIWNIVFSQYNAEAGKARSEYRELPSKNIDTGMGLERMACVMQEVETNYETDLFLPIIQKTSEITGVKYNGQMAFKVIADHVRSVVFAVADGAVISNEGRGYVLRRILRRAVRYGKKLGMREAFLWRLVPVVAENMQSYYPYLLEKVEDIARIIRFEEEKFLQTLEAGEKRLLEYLEQGHTTIPGEIAFLLYDTFGFPLELTLEVAQESGATVDEEGFQRELSRQKEQSRSSRNEEQSMNIQNEEMLRFTAPSTFIGYKQLEVETEVIGLFQEQKQVEVAGGTVLAIFKETPFYAESGGQIGDVGVLEIGNAQYKILTTTKMPNFQHASLVELGENNLRLQQKVVLKVDKDFRKRVERNHSATHLLNEALRRVLGRHVYQQGSYVGDNILRFDFNNYNPLMPAEILAVEKLVNEKIREEIPVKISEMALEEAKKDDVQAVFGEKYGDIVRVVNMDFSKELCGGCHVNNTGEIKALAILSIESKGSGIFRIEAATGDNIRTELDKTLAAINQEIGDLLTRSKDLKNQAEAEAIVLDVQEFSLSEYQPSYEHVLRRREELALLREQVKEWDKKLARARKERLTLSLDDYLKNNLTIGNINVLISQTEALETEVLKDLVDRLADKLGTAVVFLANVLEDRVIFVCKSKVPTIHAGNLVKEAAIVTAGNGGGRPDFAQAGGKDPSKVNLALDAVRTRIESTL
jgi:alanyl-tRNA synthetase